MQEASASSASAPAIFTSYQKLVIAVLAFLQFTVILDFMILSPLGALLMPTLNITPKQFGLVVSVYAFSAGISGFLAAGFADRFDRKKLLLFFYTGFVLGTLLCGVAPSYRFLLFARMITGIFGGVVGSIGFAIVTDLFVMELRGRVMGFLQTAFAASQVLGIPIGLFLSNNWGWHAPFLMIVAVSTLAGIVIVLRIKPIDTHLTLKVDHNPFHHLLATISKPRYIQAYATTALLSTGGFMLMPFSSAFNVHNLGINIESLPIIYLVTGLFSIVSGPLIGKFTDSVGAFKVFCFGSLLTTVMVIVYTHLSGAVMSQIHDNFVWATPLVVVICVSVVMFTGVFSRMIPSSALMSAIPTPSSRGSFMSVSSSLQQIAGGVSSMLAGYIVVEGADGSLGHFDTLGYVIVGSTVITVVMMYTIHKYLQSTHKIRPTP